MMIAAGVPCMTREGHLFVRDRHRIMPMGPILDDIELMAEAADELLAGLGGQFVQWTRPLTDERRWRGWYAVVCTRFVEIESVPSASVRSKIRRGLKRCEVARVDLDGFKAETYEVHVAALRHYGQAQVPTREAYEAMLERERGFDDLRHYWIVRVEGRPAAYAKTILHDRREVDYTAVKFDPQQLKHYTSYALLHEMNRFYLGEQRFDYANDGQRSVLHDTNFQEFLVRDLGFERRPLALYLRVRRTLRAAMPLARLMSPCLVRLGVQAHAMLELIRCATDL